MTYLGTGFDTPCWEWKSLDGGKHGNSKPVAAHGHMNGARAEGVGGTEGRAIMCRAEAPEQTKGAGDDYYRGYACQQLAAMWILAGENAIALSYSITAVAALEACGETAGAFLSHQVIKDCEASPVQKAAEVKPVVEGCAAAADVARNGRHGPMGIQQQ